MIDQLISTVFTKIEKVQIEKNTQLNIYGKNKQKVMASIDCRCSDESDYFEYNVEYSSRRNGEKCKNDCSGGEKYTKYGDIVDKTILSNNRAINGYKNISNNVIYKNKEINDNNSTQECIKKYFDNEIKYKRDNNYSVMRDLNRNKFDDEINKFYSEVEETYKMISNEKEPIKSTSIKEKIKIKENSPTRIKLSDKNDRNTKENILSHIYNSILNKNHPIKKEDIQTLNEFISKKYLSNKIINYIIGMYYENKKNYTAAFYHYFKYLNSILTDKNTKDNNKLDYILPSENVITNILLFKIAKILKRRKNYSLAYKILIVLLKNTLNRENKEENDIKMTSIIKEIIIIFSLNKDFLNGINFLLTIFKITKEDKEIKILKILYNYLLMKDKKYKEVIENITVLINEDIHKINKKILLFMLGMSYYHMNNSVCIKYLHSSLNGTREFDHLIFSMLGVIYFYKADFNTSEEMFNKSLEFNSCKEVELNIKTINIKKRMLHDDSKGGVKMCDIEILEFLEE